MNKRDAYREYAKAALLRPDLATSAQACGWHPARTARALAEGMIKEEVNLFGDFPDDDPEELIADLTARLEVREQTIRELRSGRVAFNRVGDLVSAERLRDLVEAQLGAAYRHAHAHEGDDYMLGVARGMRETVACVQALLGDEPNIDKQGRLAVPDIDPESAAGLRLHPGVRGVLDQLEDMVEMFRASTSEGDLGAQHFEGEWQQCAELTAKLIELLGGKVPEPKEVEVSGG